jgi:hypothetical protein
MAYSCTGGWNEIEKRQSEAEPRDAGNSRIASRLIAYEDSNIIVAGYTRFRGCA